MSAPTQQGFAEISPSETIRIEAADWILKRRTAMAWTNQDQLDLKTWQTQSTAHLVEYLRLEAAWKQTDRLAALRGPARLPAPQGSSRKHAAVKLSVAFVLTALVAVGGASHFIPGRDRAFSTGIGGHERLTLSDGSLVELNTNTKIRLAASESTRTVYLDKGEAYFKISHDAARPFVVLAGSRRVIDVGTAFVVRRESKALSVTLIEGRARFDTPGDESLQAIELKPGNQILVTSRGIVRRNKTASQLADELGWRRGNLVFYGTSLSDAVHEFNRYNTTKLVVTDPQVGQLKVNGTFSASNARAFVDATKVVFNLKLETRNGEIVISK